MRRALVGLAVVVVPAGAVAAPSVVSAHAGDPNIETVIAGLRPGPIAGVDIEIVQGVVPALSALNSSSRELQVLDAHGTPFLRLGPLGTEGNTAAVAFYRSAAPGGTARVPPGIGSRALRARWVVLARTPAWAWYDDRVPNVVVAPGPARDSASPTKLGSFSIPLRYGGQPLTAQGEITYVPPRARPVASLTSPAQPAPGVTVALLAGARPDLYVQNSSGRTVTILGAQGEPFAQIGPHGVRVNLRSPIHAADAVARGDTVPTAVNPSAPPLWRPVSTAATYDWLDPRPRLEARWTVPMLLGNQRLAITGTLSSVPGTSGRPATAAPKVTRNGGDTALPVAVVAGVLLVLAGALFARRAWRNRT